MTGDTLDKIKRGLKGTAEGVKEGVKDTAEGVKDTAEEAVEPNTYTGSEGQRKKSDYNEAGGKEPMNPEDIASHEPTAVKRDEDKGIAEGGQTGTDSPEAREKYKKSGMTDAK
jgi:hypothetical protein